MLDQWLIVSYQNYPIFQINKSSEQQLKCASESRAKELRNETQQVCFQISKLTTIITFESRKRSKRVEGNPHTADIRESSSPELYENRCFFKCQPCSKISPHFSHWIFHSALLYIIYNEKEWKRFLPHLLHATKLENVLFYVRPLWQQAALPHCLYTIKHSGSKLLNRGFGHIHCYKHGYTKFPKKSKQVACAAI